VYLHAIQGHVPTDMIRALRAFLEFCYIARRNSLSEHDLDQLNDAVSQFHQYREVFISSGVRNDFLMPKQHSIIHYHSLIRLFGAPNGLCSSITESKHIRAVKEPWRRSNRNEALGQMLVTNQRLNQLAAARTDFSQRGMLNGSCLTSLLERRMLFIHSENIVYVDIFFFSVEAVAATLSEDSLPSQGDDMEAANMDDSVPPTLIEDEDTTGHIVNKPDVIAEVKLPSRVRKCQCSFHCLL
jgi:hypothetical protein